ncbi:serine/threonine protein kinase [Sediminispirochaeta bajacaliforniensis]|uniref:serine/threonine protein kinase n=1 Tax=Sediminispirochaeta bajacaliforniensis TaxID=148 RepID=UPI0003662244|nr:serine/threonine protein kinase [Sediminispirochaeta bajacaliforniensis]
MENEKPPAGIFDYIEPDGIISAVEMSYGINLDGTWSAFPSYVNRVYGLRDEDGNRYVVKLYRPGRWSVSAIEEEHGFLLECVAEEVPVVAPLSGVDGRTLHFLECSAISGSYPFALFPLRAGRLFETDRDEDYLRIGSLIGRLHRISRQRKAQARQEWLPSLSKKHLEMLLEQNLVPSSLRRHFEELCLHCIETIEPLFSRQPLLRLHGDCHRGNILERPGEGLVLIDFDDMSNGPAVQDLWLLLPDRIGACEYQFSLLQEGYGQFSTLSPGSTLLIEPLRFMRMLHYLAWTAHQQCDHDFSLRHPQWGSEAFWIRELADFEEQFDYVRTILDSSYTG